jgi:hypothetical protein
MRISKRAVMVGVLLSGQVARAEADTLPSFGVGAGAFRDGADKSVSFVTDLFLGVDVRAQDPVPGLKYPAFIARAHLLLGGTSRFEPRAYLAVHSSSWSAFLSGREETAFALGVGPSIPLGSEGKLTVGVFAQVTASNFLSLEVGARSLSGPLDLSATVQFDIALGLLTLARAMGDH